MQHDCVGIGTLACLPSFDFTSSFLLQNDPPLMYGFSSMDTVGPYNCNGSGISISSMPEGTADNRARRSNDERKKRRLASNRESAKRSRVRKQRRLGELSAQVTELRDTKQRLLVELNHVIARYTRVARENAELREQFCDLQKRLNEMGVEGAEDATRTPLEVA
ncbi:hypothetical protein QOZ80_2BG0157920 [Eleusine coracana subsp. coracana]|nr:hypothetical protein QOZ80_2BG0157920 [Eleusine coracana subsp. coracana]